ncbi:MAG: SPOR domain-containing protein [Bacteroidales bacterium]
MKKLIFYSIVTLIAVGVSSCKPKESAYKAAYERAKQKEIVTQPKVEEVVKPVVTVTPPVAPISSGKERVTKERITPVVASDESGLKNFSVVIGSFINNENAGMLKSNIEKDGYRVILAQNEKQMYRVIVASFNTKDEAAAERDRIKAKYAPRFDDIWLLERQ